MPKLTLKCLLTSAVILGLTLIVFAGHSQAISSRGDFNNDKSVDGIDLSFAITNFESSNIYADFNHDGMVNGLDISILLVNFGQTTNTNQTLGAAMNHFQINDPQYTNIISKSFDSITPEYEWQMNVSEPSQNGVFDFSLADQVVNWAQANNKKVRGHNLIWGDQLPNWLTSGNWTKQQLLDIEQQLIQTTINRYKNTAKSWNVINEAFNDDGSLRNNFWEQNIGPEYIADAFVWAHQADPTARLFINDYSLEHNSAKVDAVYDYVTQLKSGGTPIDGVAFQAHLLENWQPDRAEFTSILNRFAQAGFQVEITELDVKTSVGTGTTAQRLAQEAQMYQDIGTACKDVPACTGITAWGAVDTYSWLGASEMALPFDSNYQPKQAFYSLISALSR